MTAGAPETSAPAESDRAPLLRIQVWRLGLVVLGLLMLLAHPLLGTTVPLPGGNVVAGLLLPLLLFASAFLPSRAASSPKSPEKAEAAAPESDAEASPEGGRVLPERRELARRTILVVTPIAAAAAVLVLGLFAAVACFGAGSAALVALGPRDVD